MPQLVTAATNPDKARDLVRLRIEYDKAPLKARLPSPVAAAGIGVSPATMETWRRVGRGPKFYRISANRVVYEKADIELFRAQECGVLS